MAKALSIDLRKCVVAAIAAGMSRRQKAERFGVSAASALPSGSMPRNHNPHTLRGDTRHHAC